MDLLITLFTLVSISSKTVLRLILITLILTLASASTRPGTTITDQDTIFLTDHVYTTYQDGVHIDLKFIKVRDQLYYAIESTSGPEDRVAFSAFQFKDPWRVEYSGVFRHGESGWIGYECPSNSIQRLYNLGSCFPRPPPTSVDEIAGPGDAKSDSQVRLKEIGRFVENPDGGLPILVMWRVPQADFHEFHLIPKPDPPMVPIFSLSDPSMTIRDQENCELWWEIEYERDYGVVRRDDSRTTCNGKIARHFNSLGYLAQRLYGGGSGSAMLDNLVKIFWSPYEQPKYDIASPFVCGKPASDKDLPKITHIAVCYSSLTSIFEGCPPPDPDHCEKTVQWARMSVEKGS